MDEPPFLLDAARVLAYAALDLRAMPRGSGLVVGGVTIGADNVSRVAVVRALVDDRHYLLHCNERWETVAAGEAKDAGAARAEAQASYGAALGPWQDFRSLTDDERNEAETTRGFLRSIAADSEAGPG